MTEYDFEPVEMPGRYAKAFVATATAALLALVAAMQAGPVEAVGVVHVALAVVSTIGVVWVPMFRAGIGRWLKMIVALVGTGLQALVPLLLEGTVTPQGWLMVTLAALGAIGVGITPNAPADPEYVRPGRV